MRLNLQNVRNAYPNAEHITVLCAFVPDTGYVTCNADTVPDDATTVEVRFLVPEYQDGHTAWHREVQVDFGVAELRDADATIRVRGLNVGSIERALDGDFTASGDGTHTTPRGAVRFGTTFVEGTAAALRELAAEIDASASANIKARFWSFVSGDISPDFAERMISSAVAGAKRQAARIAFEASETV